MIPAAATPGIADDVRVDVSKLGWFDKRLTQVLVKKGILDKQVTNNALNKDKRRNSQTLLIDSDS